MSLRIPHYLNEFNSIPEDWKLKKLLDVSMKITDGTHKTPKYVDKGVPFLSTTNLQPFHPDFNFSSYQKFITKKEHEELIIRCKPELNDILISKCGTIGRSQIVSVDYDFSIFVGLALLKPDLRIILSTYLEQLLNSNVMQKQMELTSPGSTRKTLTINAIGNLLIPVPSLVEQRGIVEVLGTVDECIRLTDAVIERAEELKRGLMQRLLTRGIGHTEYKETPLGKIPKTWKISTFGKECNIGTGGTPRRNQSDYYNGNIPWVKSTELNYGIISDTEEHISKKALEESNAKIYPTGTLLIAMYGLEAVGTRGRCAILGVNAATNQAIAAIQPKKQILPRFLYYYYQQMGNLIMKYAEGTKRKNLSLSIMKKIPIIVPPIKEQEKIVKIIENQDDKTNIENHKMNQLNILKQGLMQSLLSGKIRVELKGDGLHRIRYGRKANN